jgi:hypothetical protein
MVNSEFNFLISALHPICFYSRHGNSACDFFPKVPMATSYLSESRFPDFREVVLRR